MSTSVNYGNILSEIQMNQDEIDYMVKQINEMPSDGLMVEWGCAVLLASGLNLSETIRS